MPGYKASERCIFAVAVSNEYSLCPNILMFFITVMHLGAIACGVHKYDLYCYHLQGSLDMLQGVHMSILGMNGFVQFAQRMTSVI